MTCVAHGQEAPEQFEPPLDPGIAPFVLTLRRAGVETFEACQGGPGHAYREPTIRFHGDRAEGLRALAVAMAAALPVEELRRTWPILNDEPTGPWWELTFSHTMSPSGKLELFSSSSD